MNNITEYKDLMAFHPGYYIADVIEDMGISQAEFAQRLGTTAKNLSTLLNGQTSLSDDINYAIRGRGKAVCDGREETLESGCCHICPKGCEHSIENTGEEDFVLFTVVCEREDGKDREN